MNMLRRYRYAIGILVLNLIVLLVSPRVGANALKASVSNLRAMLEVLPPIFLLLGLLDVWVDRETMTRMMGTSAGFRGLAFAFLMGSIAAGPLYAAFPVVGVLLRKGSTLFNALVLIGAWTTTKITLLLFETTTMGWRFMLMRFVLDIPVVLVIAYVTEHLLTSQERAWIYSNAQEL